MKRLIVGAALLSGCAWITPNHIADVTTIISCVLQHRLDPPLMIAQTCGVEDVQQVIDILSSYNKAKREDSAENTVRP